MKPAVPGNKPEPVITVERGSKGKLFTGALPSAPEPVAVPVPEAKEPEPVAEPEVVPKPEPAQRTFAGATWPAEWSKQRTTPLIDGDILWGLEEKVEKLLGKMTTERYYEQMLRNICSLESDLTRWTTLIFKDIISKLKKENCLSLRKWASQTVSDKLGKYKNFCSAETQFLMDESGIMDEADAVKYARVGDRLRRDIKYLKNVKISADGKIVDHLSQV